MMVAAVAIVHGATVATAATLKVGVGEDYQSIQDAVDAASDGDTVKVQPGTYVETHGGAAAVRITKPLKLVANSRKAPVVLSWDGVTGSQTGILVEPETDPLDGLPSISGIKIKGFTIENFPRNGIETRYVEKFKIIGNESKDNLHNGIFPTLSAKGVVKKNVSYGALDSALWVEASTDVRVIKNELYDSPTGLEITVSKNIKAKKNDIHDNVVGIGLYHPNGASLPPLGGDGDWDIINNHVYNNNKINTVQGGLVSMLPSGAGVLVIGVDRVNLKKNVIENNNFFGIAVIDWCLANDCGSDPVPAPGNEHDQHNDDNKFVKNTISNNGLAPDAPPELEPFEVFAADVIYLQTQGHLNCFAKNTCSGSPCAHNAGISGFPFFVNANSC